MGQLELDRADEVVPTIWTFQRQEIKSQLLPNKGAAMCPTKTEYDTTGNMRDAAATPHQQTGYYSDYHQSVFAPTDIRVLVSRAAANQAGILVIQVSSDVGAAIDTAALKEFQMEGQHFCSSICAQRPRN